MNTLLRRFSVLIMITLTLVLAAQAQSNSSSITVRFNGEKPIEHKELAPGEVSRHLADFLRDKRDGVLTLKQAQEKGAIRFEKSGPKTRMVREASTEDFIEQFVGAREQGLLTMCKSNLKNYGTASEMWSTDYSGRYPETIEELTPNYLRTLPKCPTTESAYTYSKVKIEGYDSYQFSCNGDHSGRGVEKGYPKYNGVVGLILPDDVKRTPKTPATILSSCKSNLKNYGTAAEMWSTDYSGNYPERIGQLAPDYLRYLPKCPSKSSEYTYRRVKIQGQDVYEFTCTGDHSDIGVPKGYPQYNGMEGIVEKP